MSKLRTLQSLVDRLSEAGERPAVEALRKEDVESWTYAELADHTRRLAAGLVESGVGRGEHVALLASNRPEWFAACLAVFRAGAVVVPLDVSLEDEALTHALNDSGGRRIFTTGDQADRLDRLELEARPEPLLLDAEDERGWARLLADEPGELPEIKPEDPAALFYTSGTTGRAKGVPLTHANIVFQLNTLAEAGLVNEEDRVLLPLPLHHVYPFVVGMLTPLNLGLTVVMPYALTGPQLVRAMREGEVSVVIGVPRLYDALYSGIEERAQSNPVAAGALRSGVGFGSELRRRTGLPAGKLLMHPLHRRFGPKLRVLASGGAPLDPELAWNLEGMGWQVAIGYGLTETSPLLTLNPPGSLKLGSAGRPIPGVEVVVDTSAVPGEQDGEGEWTREPNREGEILARGPGVFSGYRNMPEETEEVFTEDGWYRTGDLGYFDEEGFLYVTGRASTLIVTEGGKNVQPEDVEEAYLESPYIREVGVLQDEGRLVGVIVPETSEIQDRGEVEEAIRDAVRERSRGLPAHQRIADYVITRQPLEYTQLGKLRRHVLEERYEQAGEEGPEETPGPVPVEELAGEDRDLLENPAARQVWDWLAGRYSDRRLAPETHLHMDLGIDSLEWVNLTLEIGQRTGIELEEDAIERVETVRDLLQEVAGKAEAGEGGDVASPLEHPERVLDERQVRLLRPLDSTEASLAQGMFSLNRFVARGPFALRVEGLENLPEEGPFLIAPNHVSYLDAFAVAAALDNRRLQQTYWGGWVGAAFGNPVSRFVSRLAQVVPVDPNRAGTSSLAFSAAVLERGKNLVWFPEGQRSSTGELQPFKPGVGMLLERFRVPVVPVFIRGTYEAMPPGRLLPRPRPVTVTFGEPLSPDDLERRGKGEQAQDRITNALRDSIADLGRRSEDRRNDRPERSS
jgi:long-chain acyl-CoA synthetase